MNEKPEIRIREAEKGDLPSVSAFMRAQQQARCDETYLHHWYFQNPVRGGSLTIGELAGKVVGMATTNAHRFERKGAHGLVAMPQKVLTDASLRGQGVFGRLYRECEGVSLRGGANFFLTVTNAASTDIFLEKFGYSRLPSPRMAVMISLPGKTTARSLGPDDAPRPSTGSHGSWRMAKDSAHLKWRYLDHPLREYTTVRCSGDSGPIGDLFLRRTKTVGYRWKGLTVLSASDPTHFPELMRTARRIAWQQRCFALLSLVEERFNDALRANGPTIRRSSGFNLLEKGMHPADTAALAEQTFELSFGDLDFF